MDESQSFFSKPTLPPKRKPALGENAAADSTKSSSQQQTSEENLAQNDLMAKEQNDFISKEEEIDPELLADYVQALNEVGSEVVIDLAIPSKETTVTAPILEDYIDPHAIPIKYLLEQARTQVQPDQVLQNSSNAEPDEPKEN